ncbi:MAG TPA: hypothetical protein QGH10_23500, partial [Armatimonadota bacterium]|nr:hypothetical protein [Armatimonadota bacterium]
MRVTTACLLAFVSICSAQDYAPPTLRHVNVIAIHPTRGQTLQVGASCETRGPYQDALSCRIIRPDGFVASAARIEAGDGQAFAADVDWDDLAAIHVASGWNAADVTLPDDLPHAYRSEVGAPLKTIRAWGPLHFQVPEGTTYFNVWIHASVTSEGLHYVIADADGNVAAEEDGDFDDRTKVQIRVPEGMAGKAWSIGITDPDTPGMNLDDVYVELGRHLPPFLAPKAEWAALFGGAWSYDPDAPKPPTRFEPTEPTVEPFHGREGLDQAFDRDPDDGWATSLPFTYVLDYGSKHLGNPDYVPTVATAPPTLLHLGKDVPLNHGWGPVQALGGENQAYGFGDHIRRLSPDEVAERIAGLRDMVDQLHESGVRWVTPYVCGMTVNGDIDRRSGFWEFYDHWEDYRKTGLGPKPATDPAEWLQLTPGGLPARYYGYTEGFYPPFKDNHRYAACWRRAGWRAWLAEVVRFAARCGHDGVFVDNANSQRCLCSHCLSEFREFLRGRHPAREAEQLFGMPIDGVAFPVEKNTELYAELCRFWCETIADELATIKRIGSEVLGREFIVFPNGGRPAYIQRGTPDADFVMFEKSVADYGTNPGMVLSPVFEGVTLRVCNDNIFEHKFVQSLRRRVRPIILSRGGYPRRLPHLMMNPNAARLGMAECGAFSGGGGFLLRPDFGVYHDAMNEYRRFFEEHPALYAGLRPYAQIAVLALPERGWAGDSGHMASVKALTTELHEGHVLFDYVSEDRFTPEIVNSYDSVVVTGIEELTDEQKRVMADVESLVVIGMDRMPDSAPALICPDDSIAPYVKINAYRDESRIIAHVVNYNVPLGVIADDPKPIEGIKLSIPLPDGATATSATAFAPGEGDVSLEVTVVDGRAGIALPPLS